MNKKIKDILLRYSLIFLALIASPLLYLLLSPATIYPVYFILKIFYPIILQGTALIMGDKQIELIKACLGVSAMALLIILNLATPSIKFRRRLKLFIWTISAFLVFNWLRIILLSHLFLQDFVAFNQIHLFTWYFVSTLAVVIIWIGSVKMLKIREMPFLSDFKEIYRSNRN